MDDQNKATHIVNIHCVDTLQYSFASHLSIHFGRKGISAFVNSKRDLDVNERASASVVIFSKNYLSFESNLDKLMSVLECQKKNGLIVIPVFYGINPSDLVVPEHGSANRTGNWSSALQELSKLSAHQSRECERDLVEEIVKDVYEKLFPAEQIGINLRLQQIEQLLCKQPWGIRRIGIWGMPGIGKTTLAKTVFDQISGGYEASCFIKDFDKAFHEKGFHRLLWEHFGKILKEMPRVCSSITRPSFPGDKLSKKRTLIVLDDVHNPLVSNSFLGGIHWFGPGSLIIVTSRDKHVFRLCQINDVHEVQSLNENEALQLFYWCACVKDMREQNLLKLSMEVVDYANGNPLALRFYGGELKGKRLSAMETAFAKLQLRMPYKIYDLFKSSYETLNDNEKNIFLDIACFFTGENVDYVIQLLEGCGFFPHVGIDVLVEKCLVTISENRVKMHRIIQDFGREIINGETVQIERRRRLWEPWTIKFLLEDDVLKTNGDLKATYARALGTEDIEGIFLDTSNLIFDVKPGAFENMLSLRFLKIYCSRHENHYGPRLSKGLESLPYELRLIHWENYPLHSLPQDFDPCHLVELSMSYSQLQKLWGGTKNLHKLKILKLSHSQHLTNVDDISKAQNIELIDLQGCIKLQSLPAMGQLQHLRVVNLSGCTEIRSFPEVSPNIEELHLQETAIRELPISYVTVSKQVQLNKELPLLLARFPELSAALNHERLASMIKAVSSNHLGKLFCLNMKDCVHLRSLPHMAVFESLKVLNLSGCKELDDIGSFPRNLKELYLVGTAIKEIPRIPSSVELLNAHGCVSLTSLPLRLEQLPRYYTYSNCFALSATTVMHFVKKALSDVESIAREYHQAQKIIKALAFSLNVPSHARENSPLKLQSGSSVMIELGSSWRSTLGVAILVEVAFLEDYDEDSGFGVSCVCRWKNKECVSHRLERNFDCTIPGEGVPKDHMFAFCDLNMHLSACEGNDPSILADLVLFEFFTVNKQKKLLHESCTVKKCGVHVLTVAKGDTSFNMNQEFSSLDYPEEIFDDEIEEVSRVIYDDLDENDRNLFFYISCLFSDEEYNFLPSLVARIGMGISSRLKVLASKSLIHISPLGTIVRQGLLQKIGREIVFRPSILPRRSIGRDIKQLDEARNITSSALLTSVSALESETSDLQELLAGKEKQIAVLQSYLESLNASLSDKIHKLSLTDGEKENLLREHSSLSNTVKILQKDFSKLEGFKNELMMSLQDDDQNAGRTQIIAKQTPNVLDDDTLFQPSKHSSIQSQASEGIESTLKLQKDRIKRSVPARAMDSSSASLLKGFELGKLVLSSGLLQTSWGKISEIHQSQDSNQNSGLGIKIYREAKYTLVVFVAPPIRRNSSGLTRLSESKLDNPFHFLCSEKISSFSVYTPAFEVFFSAYRGNLPKLKSKLLELLKSDKSVIITGAALGGSVASLFTLWLLETIDPKLRRPLCITFGAPLIGDAFLQQILENSLRNSCFLHVAQGLDVATKAAQTPIEPDSFKPFGTFLICFDSECICIEDPEATMELLVGVNTDDLVEWRDYGDILQRLDQTSMTTDSKLMIDDVIIRMEGRKKLRFDQLKKLNNMKISLIHIEWYKKKSKINKIGYYDRYKSKLLVEVDMVLERRKKELNDFWKSMVEEVEKKPQSEKSILKTRCLFAGNNYRRMIEPLDIAEYYRDGRRDYRNSGRSRHYVMLEKWFKEEKIELVRCKKRDLSDLLTFDSCFWAEVEESLIVIDLIKTQVGMGIDERKVLMGKLERFEEYVWGMIGKREVSPEIFLEESSFMKWWREYKWINGSDSDSPASNFTEFMNTGKYERYGQSQ